MIDRDGLSNILEFVSRRWAEMVKNPQNKALQNLPANFWMNSVGGRAGAGRWLTMLLYTENQADAEALKEVLLRWQTMRSSSPQDLIQIKRK